MNINYQLEKKVEANLAADEHLRDYAIEVVVQGGAVTLKGELPSREMTESAEAIARKTEGVVTVINDIVINRAAYRIPSPPVTPRPRP
jgi:osmotically-inducible protein OsmY